MKKTFIALALLCLFASCKKDNNSKQQTINVIVSNVVPAYTTYNITITNNGNSGLSVQNANSNTTYTITATSGSTLNMQYYFTTQGQQYGQGDLDVTCGSQTLLHVNGGNGINDIIKVP